MFFLQPIRIDGNYYWSYAWHRLATQRVLPSSWVMVLPKKFPQTHARLFCVLREQPRFSRVLHTRCSACGSCSYARVGCSGSWGALRIRRNEWHRDQSVDLSHEPSGCRHYWTSAGTRYTQSELFRRRPHHGTNLTTPHRTPNLQQDNEYTFGYNWPYEEVTTAKVTS